MRIEFISSTHEPMDLPDEINLSEVLSIENSPVLFGCRTGICGTCLVEVEVLEGELSHATGTEKELLEIIAPERPNVRLACQLRTGANIKCRYVGGEK